MRSRFFALSLPSWTITDHSAIDRLCLLLIFWIERKFEGNSCSDVGMLPPSYETYLNSTKETVKKSQSNVLRAVDDDYSPIISARPLYFASAGTVLAETCITRNRSLPSPSFPASYDAMPIFTAQHLERRCRTKEEAATAICRDFPKQAPVYLIHFHSKQNRLSHSRC